MDTTVKEIYIKLDEQFIDTLDLTVETYQHKSTGALHYHLNADNPENVFLVGLRTVPTDSSGAAHILEHTVLCGSKKYPVRDPFFMMIRRSLNTFMNAFTSSDWTAYPFASLNKVDFNNLLDVYLDAVFFPNIDPLDFAQEGHRVEFEETDNLDSPLVYKGVVFNEMKGSMSSPVSFAWQKFTSYLYQGTTYHFNSGGDPANIPELSYDGLKAFYKKHYHPSNAVFFTFGNIPATEHQEKIHEHVLQNFEHSPADVTIEKAIRFTEPVSIIDYFPAQESDNKQHVIIGWLLGESADLRQQMAAILLSSVLLDNSASPLRYALENTDIGAAPSPLCGLEESNREMAFICGLEGVVEGKENEVESLVLDVLKNVANNGVEYARLEAVLHQIEFSQQEITGGSYPYGLQLILDMLPMAVHGGDPVAAIHLQDILDELNEAIKDPQYIKNLVSDLLINNSHRLHLVLKPDHELKQKQDQAEISTLSILKAEMTEADKKAVVEQAVALKNRQETIDDESVLPKVGITDVPDEMNIAHGKDCQISGVNGTAYAQGTNGIIYEQIVTPIPALSQDELSILPLYTYVICELGAGKKSYLDMQALMDSHTGGISCFTSMRSQAYDVSKHQNFLVFSGKALLRKREDLAELVMSFINEARFNETDRIKDLITQWRVRKENSITGQGHSLAMMASSQAMSPLANYKHHTRGLLGIQQVKHWDEALTDKTELDAISERLQALHAKLTQGEKQFLLISDEHHLQDFIASRENWYSQLPNSENESILQLPKVTAIADQCWLTKTQVNFCAKSYRTVAPYHDDGPPLMVLGGFLKNGFLHRVVREQGGAYGGGASYDSDAGAFRFYSYRDPRLSETLQDFDASIDWLLSHKHTYDQLEQAILGVVSNIDKPASPAGEAKSAFHNALFGRTPEKRQEIRRRVLEVSIEDLLSVAGKYLRPENASSAVLTNHETWDKEYQSDMQVYTL